MPDADPAPIALGRHINGAHIALHHAGARPIGMVEQNFTVADDLAHLGDMAVAHARKARHRHHSANARGVTPGIAALGLRPPAIGIAAQINIGHGARIGHALKDTTRLRKNRRRKHGQHQSCSCKETREVHCVDIPRLA